MRKYSDVVTNQIGLPVSGASVTVYLTGTNTKATIYSDDGVTTTSNPVTSDSLGTYSFYIGDGRYDLTVTGTGITTKTISDFEISDAIGSASSDNGWNVKTINNIRFASQFAGATSALKIQATASDAGANGIVICPPGMAAGDPTSFTSGCTVLDFRSGGMRQLDSDGSRIYESFKTSTALSPDTHGYLEMYSIIRPAAQTDPNEPPLGHDAALHARAAADLRLRTEIESVTASTPVGGAGSATVTTSNNANLYLGGPIVVNRNKSDQETIAQGNWSKPSTTSIAATFTAAHTQPFTIDQRGTLLLDAPAVSIRMADNTTNLMRIREVTDSSAANNAPTIEACGTNLIVVGADANHNVFYYTNGTVGNFYRTGTTSGASWFFSDNATTNSFTLKVDTVNHFVTVAGGASTHPRLFLDDTLNSSGSKFSISSGSVATGALDMVNETSGVRFFRYDDTSKIQLKDNVTLDAGKTLKLGAGTAISGLVVYSQSLAPSSVSANTTAEQDFTVTGVTTADKIILNKPSHQAGLGIVNVRAKAADTISITYMNCTGSPITPSTETYQIMAIRS